MVTFHFKKEGMTDFKTHTASVTPTQKAQCVAAVKSPLMCYFCSDLYDLVSFATHCWDR
jgi:hypothetical protein